MKFHYGFEHPNPTKVFCLRKSIYGLKQSLCYWFAKLIKVIVSNRAGPTTHTSRSLRETYVYTSWHMWMTLLSQKMISLLYTSSRTIWVSAFIWKTWANSNISLELKLLATMKAFFFSVKVYVVHHFRGWLTKPCSTPIELNHKLSLAISPKFANRKLIEVWSEGWFTLSLSDQSCVTLSVF